jgi:xylan 1,4-beta-xylosidase
VQVLIWDYHQPKQHSPNSEFFARDWPAKPTAPVRLNISNLDLGECNVNITRVGYRHNDIYTAYLDLGSPGGLPDNPCLLSDDVLEKLRASCSGVAKTRKVALEENGNLTLDLPMNQNDIYLITIDSKK